MSCRPSGRIISPPLSSGRGENGKLYFVLPADAQQNQSSKIRNYLSLSSQSSAVVSPTLYETSLLAVALSRNMIEKRTQKKFHNRSDRRCDGTFAACMDSIRVRTAHAPRSMQTLDELT